MSPAVELIWKGDGQKKALIEAGHKISLETWKGHQWLVRGAFGYTMNFMIMEDNEMMELKQDRVQLRVRNRRKKNIAVHWVNAEGELVHNGEILPESEAEIGTFPGHEFVFACTESNYTERVRMNETDLHHHVVEDEF